MEKEEVTLMEKLILNSMKVDTVCPYCGRAVRIEPKDLIWRFGCTYRNEKGEISKKEPGGFIWECKCKHTIPVYISVGIDDERVEGKDEK